MVDFTEQLKVELTASTRQMTNKQSEEVDNALDITHDVDVEVRNAINTPTLLSLNRAEPARRP